MKPTYSTDARIKTVAGASACWIVRDICPMLRKIIDIERVQVKLNRRYMKNEPTSWRRFAKKYKGMLKAIVDRILLGRSQITDDMASAKG